MRNSHLAKKLSPEHIAKIRENNRKRIGYKMTDEQKDKIRLSHIGKKVSNETKIKMGISQKLRFKKERDGRLN